MIYDKIKLPFTYDALEPYLDATTVETHYSKHLSGYVDKLNAILANHPNITEGKSLEDIFSDVTVLPQEIRQAVINQGGGVFNHNLYFSLLSPNPKKAPEGKLLNKIVEDFSSLESLVEKLTNSAINQFGSGYAWLVINKKGDLEVISTSNQDCPLSAGVKPILTIDVWEHAYYLKYKNLRAEYVKNIWNLIDWQVVENLYNTYVA